MSEQPLIYRTQSRAAAVRELMGENAAECEIAYDTALWMLFAILDDTMQEGEAVDEDNKVTIQQCRQIVSDVRLHDADHDDSCSCTINTAPVRCIAPQDAVTSVMLVCYASCCIMLGLDLNTVSLSDCIVTSGKFKGVFWRFRSLASIRVSLG